MDRALVAAQFTEMENVRVRACFGGRIEGPFKYVKFEMLFYNQVMTANSSRSHLRRFLRH